MILLKWESIHVTPWLRHYEWLPVILWVKVSLYNGLQGPTYSLCTLPSLFQSSKTSLSTILTHVSTFLQQGLHTCCSLCLWFPNPRYLYDLLPHFPQVFTQRLSSQWGFSWWYMLPNFTTPSSHHRLSVFLQYFSQWHISLRYFNYLFIVFLSPLECKLHWGQEFLSILFSAISPASRKIPDE